MKLFLSTALLVLMSSSVSYAFDFGGFFGRSKTSIELTPCDAAMRKYNTQTRKLNVCNSLIDVGFEYALEDTAERARNPEYTDTEDRTYFNKLVEDCNSAVGDSNWAEARKGQKMAGMVWAFANLARTIEWQTRQSEYDVCRACENKWPDDSEGHLCSTSVIKYSPTP